MNMMTDDEYNATEIGKGEEGQDARIVMARKAQIMSVSRYIFTDYPDIVTVAQLQKMLGISRHQAYELINDGCIPGIKIGNAYRIPKLNVISYVMSQNYKKAVSI